jgi:3-oxoacyl-[acyl-carrier protein] reductase
MSVIRQADDVLITFCMPPASSSCSIAVRSAYTVGQQHWGQRRIANMVISVESGGHRAVGSVMIWPPSYEGAVTMSGLNGKVALVTGASSGIGRSTAIRLGADGARVGVHYRSDENGAEETASRIRDAGGAAFTLHADLGESAAAQHLWSAFEAHSAAVDIVVNNAGAPSKGGIEAATEADFDALFAINLRAPLFIIQGALTRMRDGRRIITVTSVGVQVALPPEIMYLACKGGINTLTRNLAWQLGARHITVNAVAPGFIDTPMAAPYLSNPHIRAWAKTLNALGKCRPTDRRSQCDCVPGLR